jgi:hypothetical protein
LGFPPAGLSASTPSLGHQLGMSPWRCGVLVPGPDAGYSCTLSGLQATVRMFWGLQHDTWPGGEFSRLQCHWVLVFFRKWHDVSVRLGTDCLPGAAGARCCAQSFPEYYLI